MEERAETRQEDPNGLTYFSSGLDRKLVGVEGAEPIRKMIA
jgi:hypothetical protein